MNDARRLKRAGFEALEQRRYSDAAASFARLLQSQSQDHQALCGLSAANFGLGDFETAFRCAMKARVVAPQAIGPWYVLAPAAFCAGETKAISDCFDLVRRVDRRTAAGLANFWAQRLGEVERFAEAARAFGTFIESQPADRDSDVVYAEHLLNAFRPDDANRFLTRAMSVDGGRADVFALRARLHLQTGKIDAAKADALAALRLDRNALPAYLILSEIEARAIDANMRAYLAELMHRENTPADRRSLAGFALARSLEAWGEEADAFAAFAFANALARSAALAAGLGYDRRGNEEAIAREMSRFPAAAFADAPRDPNRGAGLIFITGMPRSGSTLVDQILSSHSQMVSAGESGALPSVYREILTRSEKTGGSVLETVDLYADEWDEKYRQGLGLDCGEAQFVVDKLLPNFWRLGLIARLFPAAKIIVMERDPLDVGVSIFCQNFLGSFNFSWDLTDIAHQQKCFEAMVGYWRSVVPGVITVVYEELVGDFEARVPALLAACGLPMEPACLSFETSGNAVFTLSAAQVRRGLSRSSIGRWRRYETQVEPLRRALATIRIDAPSSARR